MYRSAMVLKARKQSTLYPQTDRGTAAEECAVACKDDIGQRGGADPLRPSKHQDVPHAQQVIGGFVRQRRHVGNVAGREHQHDEIRMRTLTKEFS